MGILDRAQSVLSSNFNALLRKFEEPGRDVGELVEQMKQQVLLAQRELVTLLGEVKAYDSRSAERSKEIETWEKRAELAVRSGDDGLAREALTHKRRLMDELQRLQAERATRYNLLARAKSDLEEMKKKTREVEQSQNVLATRVAMSRNGGDVTSLGQVSGSRPFADFDRVESSVERAEAMVAANQELEELLSTTRLGSMTETELQQQLGRLEGAERSRAEDGVAVPVAALPVDSGTRTPIATLQSPASTAGEAPQDLTPQRVRVQIEPD